MTRTMQPCGTEIAYQRHVRSKQSICFDCHRAHNAYRDEQRAAIKQMRQLDEGMGNLLLIRQGLRSRRWRLRHDEEEPAQNVLDELNEQIEAYDAAIGMLVQEAERLICQYNLSMYVVRPRHLPVEIPRPQWDWVRKGKPPWRQT